ncbi:MAG: NAD(P)-binding domain-containing protein, partial [Gemmatimonadales bacterium]
MSLEHDLIEKAGKRDALFGVIGLGYVGLPLAVELANAGYRVLGYDVSQRVVDGLNAGRSHIKDISDAQVQGANKGGRFTATTDAKRLAEPDAISICVPTPLSKFKDPDMSFIVAATEAVKRTLRKGQAI